MGGCCCSSRKSQLHAGADAEILFPPVVEAHEPLASSEGAATALATGLWVDPNLNTSSTDTFQPPPAPMPYDVVLGLPGSTDSVPVEEKPRTSSCNASTGLDLKEPNCKAQDDLFPASPKKESVKISKSNVLDISATVEEDVCPTCLEEYDAENPKIVTKCDHHFHLSCILEWMERSDTCPVCDQEMKFELL